MGVSERGDFQNVSKGPGLRNTALEKPSTKNKIKPVSAEK